jgi:hypothetical protein
MNILDANRDGSAVTMMGGRELLSGSRWSEGGGILAMPPPRDHCYANLGWRGGRRLAAARRARPAVDDELAGVVSTRPAPTSSRTPPDARWQTRRCRRLPNGAALRAPRGASGRDH